jgi:hypothetical protein
MPGIDYTLGMKTSGFDSGVSDALGKLASLGATVAKITAGAGLAAGAGMSALIAKSIGKAADMETLETAFAPLIGGAAKAKQRIAELAEFANATPFELPEVAAASRVLETLTKGALSTKAGLTLVGDVAAATNTPFQEIATSIGRLYGGLQSGRPVGEAAQRLQELGVISGDVRGRIENLQAEGKKGPEVWAVATKALSAFSGSMERQSVTWNGKMSTLGDAVSMTMAKFGQPIMDSLKPFLDGLTAHIESLQSMAVAAGQKIAGAFDIAMAAWQTGNLTALIGDGLQIAIINGINSFSSGIRKVMAYIGAAMASIADSFTSSLGGQALTGIFVALGNLIAATISKGILEAMNRVPGMRGDFNGEIAANEGAQSVSMALMKGYAQKLLGGNTIESTIQGIQKAGDAGSAAAGKAGGKPLIEMPKELTDRYAATMTAIQTQVTATKDAAAKKSADMDARLTGNAQPTEAPAEKAAKATSRPAADSLAQIGGYVGGAAASMAARIAERTENWTRKTAEACEKLLARPIPQTASSGAVF